MKASEVTNEFLNGIFLDYTDERGIKYMVYVIHDTGNLVKIAGNYTLCRDSDLLKAPELFDVSPETLEFRCYFDLEKVKLYKPDIIKGIEDPENLTQKQLQYLIFENQEKEVKEINKRHEKEKEDFYKVYDTLKQS